VDDDLGTVEGPARRRDSWSLKNLVEDIAGRPIGDLQDPDRPTHPYLKVKSAAPSTARTSYTSSWSHLPSRVSEPEPEPVRSDRPPDPVDRVYPPLVGAMARQLHGPAAEHHAETLGSVAHRTDPPTPGRGPHAPGPSQRPERIYLHYLLLHMDRLTEPALRYLKHAVDEEIRQREAPPPPPS